MDHPPLHGEGKRAYLQLDPLGIGEVEDRLVVRSKAVGTLPVYDGFAIIEPIDVRTLVVGAFGLLKIPPKPQIPIGQGKEGLIMGRL